MPRPRCHFGRGTRSWWEHDDSSTATAMDKQRLSIAVAVKLLPLVVRRTLVILQNTACCSVVAWIFCRKKLIFLHSRFPRYGATSISVCCQVFHWNVMPSLRQEYFSTSGYSMSICLTLSVRYLFCVSERQEKIPGTKFLFSHKRMNKRRRWSFAQFQSIFILQYALNIRMCFLFIVHAGKAGCRCKKRFFVAL